MTHGDGGQDLPPGSAACTQGFPGLFLLGHLNRAGAHQLIDVWAGGVADADGVDHADAAVAVLVKIIPAHVTEPVGPGTLQNAGNTGLAALAVEVIGQLGRRLVCPGHDQVVDPGKFAGMGCGKGLTAGVQCSPNHDDLGVQTHVVGSAKGHRPLQDSFEVVVQCPVDGLLHHIGGLHTGV